VLSLQERHLSLRERLLSLQERLLSIVGRPGFRPLPNE
jgi:hypothetical protein